MKKSCFQSALLWASVVILCSFSACTPQWLFQPKELGYTGPETVTVEPHEHILQPSDKIILSVWGHDELGVGSAFSVFSSTLEQGKFIAIDARGEITLPLIGEVKISDLSAREADLYLTKLFSKYLKDPIVYLRILSLEVTLIGEVRTPANYQLDKEPFSIIELIGEAG
ncbi:MAG: polysaccharide biosynthesis/export family protein, partial [Bacteroidia bacterium]